MQTDQVVIFAGGLGTRLKPMTDTVPKVMARVDGKPFLWFLLEMLKGQGFKSFLLLVAYLKEQIKDYFGNGVQQGIDITYAEEPEPLGTGGALLLAKPHLQPTFLLLNGDTYLDINYRAFIQDALAARQQGSLVVYTGNEAVGRRNVLLEKDGGIAAYNKHSASGMNGIDAGVGYFDQRVLDLLPREGHSSFEETVFPALIREKALRGFPVRERFYDIGTFDRLAAFDGRKG